jgi:hypothetical protein
MIDNLIYPIAIDVSVTQKIRRTGIRNWTWAIE